MRREKILKDGEKCARTYVCEIFARTCDVAEQEGSVRSESRSGATLSCGMSSGKRGGSWGGRDAYPGPGASVKLHTHAVTWSR